MPIRPVSGLSLYLGRLEHGFGGLFVDLLRCWSNRSRFCGKQKKAEAKPAAEKKPKRGRGRPKGSTKAKKETEAKAVEEQEGAPEAVSSGREAPEQPEAPGPPKEEKANDGPQNDRQGAGQGELDDTWDDFE